MGTSIQSPEKELRFTRSGQAVVFWMLGAILAGVTVTLLVTSTNRLENPALPHPLWALPPCLLATSFIRIAVHLTRHAYLILTPLGIEIFPFFRPSSGMRMIWWQEIHDAETDDRKTRLTLHYSAEKTGGIHLSLKPMRPDKRSLLAKAVLSRLSQPPPPG